MSLVFVFVCVVVENVVAYVVSLFVVFSSGPLDWVSCWGEVGFIHVVPFVDSLCDALEGGGEGGVLVHSVSAYNFL